jgi:hypothetical protein
MSRVVAITTTDAYQTFFCPLTVKLTGQVSNAAAAIGFGKGTPAVYGPADETYLPANLGLSRTCDEIRVKSAVAGKPAVVNLTLLTADD